jgi:spore germination protein YaaH
MRPILALLLALAAAWAPAEAFAARAADLVGFYVPWDAQAKTSLAANAPALTVFAPQWVNLADAAGGLRVIDDAAALEVLKTANRRAAIMPLVTNAHDAQWDAAAADAALRTPDVQAAVVAGLAAAAEARGFAGYILDFENLSPQGAQAYPAFVAAVRQALAPRGRRVWVTTPLTTDVATLKALAAAADRTVLMAYDQCWATSTPGPIAGVDWLTAGLAARRGAIDRSRTVLALGSYAYDWPAGAPAKVLSVSAAADLARTRSAAVTREPGSMNAAFDYRDDAGQAHQVWMADAPAFAAAEAAVGRAGFRRLGIWRLGLEDPQVWRGAPAAADPAQMARAAPPPCEPLPK